MRTAFVKIVVLLFWFSSVTMAIEPFQTESTYDATLEEEQPDDYLHHFLLNNLPVFRLNQDKEPKQFFLSDWIAESNNPTIILFCNTLWPDGFAQIRPFERLHQSYPNDNVTFAAVYIHRKPLPYLNYRIQALSADHYQFTADIQSFQTVYIDFSRPLILFISEDKDIVYSTDSYLSYKKLSNLLSQFLLNMQNSEGDSP